MPSDTTDPYAPIEQILTAWIDTAYTYATVDEEDPHTLQVLHAMRHLHLAGSLTPTAVAVYLAAQGSASAWSEVVAATAVLTESLLRFNAACEQHGEEQNRGAQGEPQEIRRLPLEVRDLVHAVDRMRDGWAESSTEHKAQLWQAVHDGNDNVWNREGP